MSISSFNITEPARSCLFLNDLTVVDHAYIDDEGRIVGGSFNPCIEVSGTPDPVEKVVVDFSTIKKDLKDLIDQHSFNMAENGFDHKVWIIEGHSNVARMGSVTGRDTHYEIITPHLSLTLPADAVKFIPRVLDDETYPIPNYNFMAYMSEAFREFLLPRMRARYPKIDLDIKCTLTTNIHVPSDDDRTTAEMFRYVHGLKDSTSYGCNNIAHGHGSFLDVDFLGNYKVLEMIASNLDDTIFVRADNVVSLTDDRLEIEYTTIRGTFNMVVDPRDHKVVVLNTETTVEYLAQYVKTRFGDLLKDHGATKLYISEGLSKGAVVLL